MLKHTQTKNNRQSRHDTCMFNLERTHDDYLLVSNTISTAFLLKSMQGVFIQVNTCKGVI